VEVVHARRRDELDVHAGIGQALCCIGQGARLVGDLCLHDRYLAERDPGVVQRGSQPGLIGRIEGCAAPVADPEADRVSKVDPALRDRAGVAGELARLVCRFNDEPLHRLLLWRRPARPCLAARGALC
jgi:hypothetical protein